MPGVTSNAIIYRITLQEHKTVPHLNSTMGGRYEGKELQYRGRQ